MVPKLLRVTSDSLRSYVKGHIPEGHTYLLNKLIPFLRSDLILDKTAKPDKGNFVDHFLCFSVNDESLPWDLGEVDW